MMKRSDLAAELYELTGTKDGSELPGVKSEQYQEDGFQVLCITVENDEGAQKIGKPIGKYITLDLTTANDRGYEDFSRSASAVRACLSRLIGNVEGSVLIAGLGNRHITPDAIGPLTVNNIMVTRHLIEQMHDLFGSYRPVSAISPGVLGLTGVETGEIVKGLAEKIKPALIIAVDALSSRRLSRLCSTIQFADSGITPGSGIGNSRFPLTSDSMGIPCIAIGVPTVVDAATLTSDVMEESGIPAADAGKIAEKYEQMLVTPKEIDKQIADTSKVIGYGINLALQKDISIEDIDAFLS